MKQQCEICGEWIPQQDMSKSYKHRCKKCVAEMKRLDRQSSKRKSGNATEKSVEDSGCALNSTDNRRTERLTIATAIMQGLVCKSGHALTTTDVIRNYVRDAINVADIMLEEIDKKGGGDE